MVPLYFVGLIEFNALKTIPFCYIFTQLNYSLHVAHQISGGKVMGLIFGPKHFIAKMPNSKIMSRRNALAKNTCN